MVVRRKFMHPGQKPSPSRLLLISLHESTIASLTAIKHPFFRPSPSSPIHHLAAPPPSSVVCRQRDFVRSKRFETTPIDAHSKLIGKYLRIFYPGHAYGFNVYIIKKYACNNGNNGGINKSRFVFPRVDTASMLSAP